MSTVFAQFKQGFRSIVIAIASILSISPSSALFAQQTMSLGSLQFALPSIDATLTSRTIHMKMASKSLNSLFYNIVGGIAFTQIAYPSFDLNSISLSFDSHDPIVTIDGQSFPIPIEIAHLIPIVLFADSDDAVLITQHGTDYGRLYLNPNVNSILYHPSMLDNLMGLRLLQVDTFYQLGGSNGDFPKIGNSTCWTPYEKGKYERMNLELKRNGAISYENSARQAFNSIKTIVNKEEWDSFIYTDIDSPISFSIGDNKIIFTGLPYYHFGKLVPSSASPISVFYYCKSLFEDFDTYLQNSKLTKDFFELYTEVIGESEILRYIQYGWELYSQDFNNEEHIDELKLIMDIVVGIYKEYGNLNKDRNNEDDLAHAINNQLKALFQPQIDHFNEIDSLDLSDSEKAELLVKYLSDMNGISTQLFLIDAAMDIPSWEPADYITEVLKSSPDLVRRLNPVVYQEVDDICHWTALFRFVKQSNIESWLSFRDAVINEAKIIDNYIPTPISLL